MRIGVISDTHKDLTLARIALEQMKEIDLLLHAGDHYKDALILAKEFNVPVKAVIGNCDFLSTKPREEVIDCGGLKIFLTHGHQYEVKSGLDRLYYRGLELNADIVIFGHTHIPVNLHIDNLNFLNPGSTTLPRGSSGPSYAMIEWGSELKITIHTITK